MTQHSVTIITPTTGKKSLLSLIKSVDNQSLQGITYHLLLWDDKRDSDVDPASFNNEHRFSIVAPPGSGRNGSAPGSLLRAIGLLTAKTPWVTFADDDVVWDPTHLEELNRSIGSAHWISTLRKIWSPGGKLIGVDTFESVGDDASRTTPYEMCDGNTMLFRREFGVYASVLYRETTEYNDDRLMYAYLKKNAGPRGRTGIPTINHTCPTSLEEFFAQNCIPMPSRTIEFFNEYHLGDNVFHIMFLRKLCSMTTDNFVYYVNHAYLVELQHHVVEYESRITLLPLQQKTPTAINAWIGEIYYTHPNKRMYDIFYVDWFNYLTTKIYGKSLNINLYSDYQPLSISKNPIDILVINSLPQSNQFPLNIALFDNKIKELAQKYSVITTRKIEGVPCTLDNGLTLVDIGCIASNASHVVAINTGPITACLNKWAISRVKSWIVGDVNHSYSFDNVTQVKSTEELVNAITREFHDK